MNIDSWDITFLKIADLISEHSKCAKHKVGAVLVKDKRILSCGYNGTPSGAENCCDIFNGKDFSDESVREEHHDFAVKNEVHAEQNAIAFAAKSGINIDGSTIYVNLQPCYECSKLIVVAGIKRAVFSKKYNRADGSVDFLRKSGVDVEFIEI